MMNSQAAPQPARKKWILWCLAAAILAFGIHEFLVMRIVAGGVHNLVSRAWWVSYLKGDDLYNPQNHVFKRGNRDLHEVCLTFDDGPHPTSCKSILDTLKRYDVQATFFLVGKRIKDHPELAKLIIDDGFEVGNHTQDHLRLDTLRLDQVKREIVNCDTNFFRATGKHMNLFRPPGMRGLDSDEIMSTVKGLGYTTVGWSIGAKDFVGANLNGQRQSPELIAHSVLKQLEDGVIILLHDDPDTAQALPEILDKLKEDKYKVLNATEMMAHLPKPIYVKSNAS